MVVDCAFVCRAWPGDTPWTASTPAPPAKADPPPATIPPLMGAFAVGVALASKLQSWRHRDDDEYDFVEADYDDDDRYDADGFYR